MYGELDTKQANQLLGAEHIGRIGYHDGPHVTIVPVAYVYDGTAVYGYTRDGRKVQRMRENPSVCLQVDRITDIGHWQSVVAWGTYQELHGDEADRAKRLIAGRLQPFLGGEPLELAHGRGSWGADAPIWRESILYRIALSSVVGRYEQ